MTHRHAFGGRALNTYPGLARVNTRRAGPPVSDSELETLLGHDRERRIDQIERLQRRNAFLLAGLDAAVSVCIVLVIALLVGGAG